MRSTSRLAQTQSLDNCGQTSGGQTSPITPQDEGRSPRLSFETLIAPEEFEVPSIQSNQMLARHRVERISMNAVLYCRVLYSGGFSWILYTRLEEIEETEKRVKTTQVTF